jgi:beta-lactamase class A
MQALERKLNELCDAHSFDTYWYLKDLKTGAEAHRAGHTVVPSASTRKIAILMTALKQVHDGKLSLDDPFLVEEQYQDTTSGTFQHLRPGFEITLFDALVMMIIVSDNTCTGKVADIVGLDDVNALCQSIGMTGTTHRDGRGSATTKGLPWDHPVEASNSTTANDLGILLDLDKADRVGARFEQRVEKKRRLEDRKVGPPCGTRPLRPERHPCQGLRSAGAGAATANDWKRRRVNKSHE